MQIDNRKLVKTTSFKSPVYIGDPLNALRIFNDKHVDEIAIVDIGATRNEKFPDVEFIRQLASECFMPMSYGGGITSLSQATEIFRAGVEKVIIGKSFFEYPNLVTQIAEKFGSQGIIVSVDFKKNWLGVERVYIKYGTRSTGLSPIAYAKMAQERGAGEILLQSIERENRCNGYELELIKKISDSLNIPVVPLGGAHTIDDFYWATKSGASGVAAGNMFIYKGKHRAVLINYPSQHLLFENLYNKIDSQ